MIEKIYTTKKYFDIDDLSNIPQTSGVYLFWSNSANYPKYIGKSINLKKRVKQHFYQSKTNLKEKKITSNICGIECIETDGELSALLLESKLIKALNPLMNRLLKKNKALYSFILNEDSDIQIKTFSHSNEENFFNKNLYGLYKSPKQAEEHLRKIANKENLCWKLTGLEKSKNACFNYQIKKCLGACIGKEKSNVHFQRLKKALENIQTGVWPKNKIVKINEHETKHIIINWKYCGTEYNQVDPNNVKFNYDEFKIIYSYFVKNKIILF